MGSLTVGNSTVCGTDMLLTVDPASIGSSLWVELRLAPCMFILGLGWRGSSCCKGGNFSNQKARQQGGVLPLSTNKAHVLYLLIIYWSKWDVFLSQSQCTEEKNTFSTQVGCRKAVTRCEQNSKNRMYFVLANFVYMLYVDVSRERHQYISFQWGQMNL